MQCALAEEHAAVFVAQREQQWRQRSTEEIYERSVATAHAVRRNDHVGGSPADGDSESTLPVRTVTVHDTVAAARTASSYMRSSYKHSVSALTAPLDDDDRRDQTEDEPPQEDATRGASQSRYRNESAVRRRQEMDRDVGQDQDEQRHKELCTNRRWQPKRGAAARRDVSFTVLMQESLHDASYRDLDLDSDSEQSASSVANSSSLNRGQGDESNHHHHQGNDGANSELAATTHGGGTAASVSSQRKGFSSPPPPPLPLPLHNQQQLPGPKSESARYLREIDRQSILSHLEQGERQAHLAREFKVSRAAICNLNKHRNDVMARRDDGNLLAEHPQKKQKQLTVNLHQATATATTTTTTSNDSDALITTSSIVHELKTRSTLLLLTKVHDRKSSDDEFKRTADRLVHLLVEDALALVPVKQVHVKLQDRTTLNGFRIESPVCAVTMEQVATPLLDVFHVLEPTFASGFLRHITMTAAITPTAIDRDGSSPEDDDDVSKVYFLDAHLPASLANHNVLLLDVVSSSTDLVRVAIEKVLSRDALESRITLVALFVALEAVASVQLRFPKVCIVTMEIDEQLLLYRESTEDRDAVKKQRVAASSPASRASLFQARYESLVVLQ